MLKKNNEARNVENILMLKVRRGDEREAPRRFYKKKGAKAPLIIYPTLINSTSKTSVALGGITPPAPRAP